MVSSYTALFQCLSTAAKSSKVRGVLLWFGIKDELLTVNVELFNIPMIPSRACLILFLPLIKERLDFWLAPVAVGTHLLNQCRWLLKRSRAGRLTQHLHVAEVATEDLRISFLELLKHFRSVLCCRDAAGLQLYCLKNLGLEALVNHQLNGFLQHVVAELVHHQSLYQEADPRTSYFGLFTQTLRQCYIFVDVCSHEDLVDLMPDLMAF